jgi:hypothetical protein
MTKTQQITAAANELDVAVEAQAIARAEYMRTGSEADLKAFRIARSRRDEA